MEKLNGLPKWFEKHPLTQQIIREEESATAARRKAALQEISALETTFQTDKAEAAVEITAAEEEVKAAVEALKNARLHYGVASHKKMVLNTAFDRLKKAQNAILMETYPPEIDQLLREMFEALDKLPSPSSESIKGKMNVYTEKKPEFFSTNAPAISEAKAYIVSAINEAEAMRTADLEGVDVPARLEELKKGIPATDVFVSGERVKPDASELNNRPIVRPRKGGLEWFGSEDGRFGEWRPAGGWI